MVDNRVQHARVMVTGGAGFIGSELTKQLVENGANVTVLDNFSSGKEGYLERLPVRLFKADICDKTKVAECIRDQEIVYHLAALPFIPDAYVDPQEFFRVNVEGSINVMWQAIQSSSVRSFVYLSSSEVYGTARTVPMNEDHATRPHSTYAVSKLAADRAVFTLHKEQGFPAVIVRLFNSYGPNITQPYIIPEIAVQLLAGNNRLRLGNIESSRDLTFVQDSARAIILASLSSAAVGEVINVGSGKAVKISELADHIARIVGSSYQYERDESRFRPYDVDRLVCDNSKAAKLLGWKPEIDLETGLRRTIDWIRQNRVSFKAPFKGGPAWYRRGT